MENKINKKYDVAIVGGGASGLMTAILVSRALKNAKVAVFEKQPRVGRKIIATGNGTCNISNINSSNSDYYNGNTNFAKKVLEKFPYHDTMSFFESIGVTCFIREDGKIYPLCLQASAVLDCMRLELEKLGVEEHTNTSVVSILSQKADFILKTSSKALGDKIFAKNVVCAVGGAAFPSLGGSLKAYDLLTDLGYKRSSIRASVVPIKADTTFIKSVKGIRVKALLSLVLYNDGVEEKTLDSEFDEVLFTEYGLSGPAVMQISRHVSLWEENKNGDLYAFMDLLPEWSFEEVNCEIERRIYLNRNLDNLLTGFINKKLGQAILRSLGYKNQQVSSSTLGKNDIYKIVKGIKGFKIKVTGSLGMKSAQITAGGIEPDILSENMESKEHRGLYITGEVLNVDGDCGGFNLQWAWATASSASKGIINSFNERIS